MADAAEVSEAVPAVAGIRNIGNTCYLNASLQAMASSPRLVHHVVLLADGMKQLQERAEGGRKHPSVAGQLLSGLQATYRFLVEGPDDSDLSVEFLTARAAQGHLTQQLAAVLTALQPHCMAAAPRSQATSSTAGSIRPPAAVDPGGLLSLLSWFTPQGVLERGLQHDAAEAFEAVMDAVTTEVMCWRKCCNSDSQGRGIWADQQQLQSTGLKQLIQPDAGHVNQHILWPVALQQQQQQPLHPVVPHSFHPVVQHQGNFEQRRHPEDNISSSSSSSNPTGHQVDKTQPCTDTFQQQQQQQTVQPHLSTEQLMPQALLQSRLPVVGDTVDLLTCLSCGYRFPRSLTAFVTLPLPLPASAIAQGHLSVPAGADLDCCLRRYGQPEVVQGVECLRCSIRASLAAAANRGKNGLQQAGCNDSVTTNGQCQQHEEQERQQTVDSSQDFAAVPAGVLAVGHIDCTAVKLLQQQQLLARLADLSSPLPPLDYQQLVQAAGLPWIKCRTAVVKQTQLARAPPVLVLQLQRSLHTGGGGLGKLQGHVRFPMQLNLSKYLHVDEQQQQQGVNTAQDECDSCLELQLDTNAAGQMVAQGQAEAEAGDRSKGLQQRNAVCTSQQQSSADSKLHHVLYQCTAVIQHLGTGHASGHYIMYRRISVSNKQQAEQEYKAVAHDGSRNPSAAEAFSSDRTLEHRWLRVNDSSVVAVDEHEVLQCHATLLMYER